MRKARLIIGLFLLVITPFLMAQTTLTIPEVQETPDGGSGPSPYEGQEVTVTGVVTAANNNGYYLQDGSGVWSGIFVDHFFNNASVGDNATVTGTVYEVDSETCISGPSYMVNSSGNPLPAAAVVSTKGMSEQYEGVLISMEGTCASIDGSLWTINDGSGDATIGTKYHTYTPTLDETYSVTGICSQEGSIFWNNPRSSEDVEDFGSAELTIAEVQETPDGGSGPSPYEGQEVTVSGVVTAAGSNAYCIQDGSAPWSGLYVNHFFNSASVGDNITITGTITESNGNTGMSSPVNYVLNSSGNELPAPLVIAATDNSEQYENVLVKIEGGTCTAINSPLWTITDDSGSTIVGNRHYVSSPELDATYNLTGIGSDNSGEYRVNPRQVSDIELAGPAELTIAEVQETPDGGSGPSPYEGQEVTVSGVVTAAGSNAYCIQDGSAPWSGLYVNHFFNSASVGDNITITGTITESNGNTGMSSPVNYVLNSSGNELPAPLLISANDNSEQYENVLVKIEGGTCTAINSPLWTITDDSGSTIVGNRHYVSSPELDSTYNVIGIGSDNNGEYRVNPRQVSDIELAGPAELTIAEVQETPDGGSGPSPYEGQEVTVTGVVTVASNNGYYLQDGTGAWNGIYVDHFFNSASVGDNATVTGTVFEVDEETCISGPSYVVNSNGNELPEATVISTKGMSEQFEGVLIRMEEGTCSSIDGNLWTINDGSGDATIGPKFYTYSPSLDDFYTVTGVCSNEGPGYYYCNPRNAEDIQECSLYAYDLGVSSFAGPEQIYVNETGTYDLTVENDGSETVTDYSVELILNGTTQIDTAVGSELVAGATETFQLNWLPDSVMTGVISANILFELDENETNNETHLIDVQVLTQNGSQIVQVGTDDTWQFSQLPADMDHHFNLSQQIFYADEINASGYIANIGYQTRFEEEEITTEPMKIWLAETDDSSLENGWIPYSEFSLVFDGTVDYPVMEGEVVIEFDEPFNYSGESNLVVMTQIDVQYEWAHGWCDYYYTITEEHPNRSLEYHSEEAFDITNPPEGNLYNEHANTAFYFWTIPVGSLEGVVFDENSMPFADVDVTFDNNFFQTTTDETGSYEFPYAFEGERLVTASVYGYYDNIKTVNVTADMVNYQDFTMQPLPQVEVSGHVTADFNTSLNIANAQIQLLGYNDYSTVTDEMGNFTIPSVYADKSYTIKINAADFLEYTQEVFIPSSNHDLGDLALTEIPVAPGNVTAEINNEANVDITWAEPGQEYPEYEIAYDNNFPATAMYWTELGGEVAIRFTPDGYPCSVTGGSVNIWDGSYPGGVQLVPFDIAVYDDDGDSGSPNIPNDFPGTELARITVLPNDFGWVEFDFSGYDINLEDGDFYISFIQTEPAPSAPPIAVDNSDPVQRSYMLYPSGGGWWGTTFGDYDDFMIRALVESPGHMPEIDSAISYAYQETAPKELTSKAKWLDSAGNINSELPEYSKGNKAVESYNVYRMLVGEEENYELWDEIATETTNMNHEDASWQTLADGVYRYAVRAVYFNGELSVPTYSNTLENGISTPVTVNVTTNSGDSAAGAELDLVSPVSGEEYSAVVPENGTVEFGSVVRDSYLLRVEKDNFEFYMQDVTVNNNEVFNVELQEIIYEIKDLAAEQVDNDVTLTWKWAGVGSVLFVDDDGSGIHEFCMDTQPFYTAKFDSLGIDYDVEVLGEGDGPSVTTMIEYDLVIWETGENYDLNQTLTDTDEDNLAIYLDNGGKLILSAQDYLYDRYYMYNNFYPGDFPYEYLGVWGAVQDYIMIGDYGEGYVGSAAISGATDSFVDKIDLSMIDVFTPEDKDGVFLDMLMPRDHATPYTFGNDAIVALATDNTIFSTAPFPALVNAEDTVLEYLDATFNGFFQYQNGRNFEGFTIKKDGVTIAEGVTELTYTDEDVEDGIHDYEVVACFSTGNSDPINTTIEVYNTGNQAELPLVTKLSGNYPNPFNPTTTIEFSLAQQQKVRVDIYNIKGEKVKTLVNSILPADNHKVVWNGKDDNSRKVASGMYFYKMQTQDFSKTHKMLLLK